ncbi:MAG: hypothetical protein LBD13_05370 [Spirochaetaceae bacterium]|jgi:hypothetical protein|nr:hypothetical protein [Spirochaetaceae bacterium]
MGINYYNSLLLYAILETDVNNCGFNLVDIIAFIDWANHAIMTYDEYNNGINYLLDNNLIEEKDEKYSVTNEFKEWFNDINKNKKRIYLHKAIENIEKYLNDIASIKTLNNKRIIISKEDYENSIKEYKK